MLASPGDAECDEGGFIRKQRAINNNVEAFLMIFPGIIISVYINILKNSIGKKIRLNFRILTKQDYKTLIFIHGNKERSRKKRKKF